MITDEKSGRRGFARLRRTAWFHYLMNRLFPNRRRLAFGASLVVLCVLGAAGLSLAAGPFDPRFGEYGVAEVPMPEEEREEIAVELGQGPLVLDIAGARRGELVAAVGSGTANAYFGAVRFQADGDLDSRFGGDGFVQAAKLFPGIKSLAQAQGVAVQRDGGVVLAGYQTGGASDPPAPMVVRLHPNGQPDRSFGHGGVVAPRPNWGRADVLRAVAIQPGGRIIAVGTRNERDRKAVQLRRPAGLVVAYRPDGSLDRGFGKAGRVFFPGRKSRLSYTGLRDLAILPNGKIVVVGYRDDRLLVARLRADGRLDSSFGGGDGIVSLDPGRGNLCCPEEASLATLPDGRIIVLTDGFSRVLMAGLRPDGRLDSRFGRGGIVSAGAGASDSMHDIAVQANGRIVAVGQGRRGFTVRRFLANGEPDHAFGRSGAQILPRGRASIAASATALPNGHVVAGGGAQYQRNDRLEYSLLLAELR